MFGNKKEGTVTFYYEKNKLFDEISEISAHMTRSSVAENGPSFDVFAVTDDERELVDVCTRHTVAAVYDSLVKISPRSESSFEFSVNVVEKDGDELERLDGEYIELTIIDNRAYNENSLTLVDESIAECLRYGTLSSFYSINVSAHLQKLSQDKFASNMLLLEQRLFQLKKKPMKSLL